MLGISALGQLAFAQFPQAILSQPKKRDTHGADHYIRRRHPPVYSEEYYAKLRPIVIEPEVEAPEPVLVQVRNLRIPLTRLIAPALVPSLMQLPPYRPMPSLTQGPPPFKMATPEEIALDDEMVIAMMMAED